MRNLPATPPIKPSPARSSIRQAALPDGHAGSGSASAKRSGAAIGEPGRLSRYDAKLQFMSGTDAVHDLLNHAVPTLLRENCDPATFVDEVVRLAENFATYRTSAGEFGVGLDTLSASLPGKFSKLLNPATFPFAQVKESNLRDLHFALGTLGAFDARSHVVVAIRDRKLQLQSKYMACEREAMKALSHGDTETWLEKLKNAEELCDRLISINGFDPDDEVDQDKIQALRKDLMKEAVAGMRGERHEDVQDRQYLSSALQSVEGLIENVPEGHRPPVADIDSFKRHLELMKDAVGQPARAATGLNTLGFQYTSWGTNHSLGSVVNTALRYLTLSTPARAVGNWVQGGRDSGVRYVAGAAIKGLASITGAVAGVASGVVSLAESIVANVGEAVLRLTGAGALAVAGSAAKLAGIASKKVDVSGDKLLGTAKDLAIGISFLSKGRQEPVSTLQVARAAELATLARITGSTTKEVRDMALPGQFERVSRADIPNELLAFNPEREPSGTGKVTKLRYDAQTGNLIGDRTSDLMIGVYSENTAGKTRYFLSFVGTQGGRPATLKSNLAQGLGIEDTAYNEAEAVVRTFVAKYGKEHVELVGHSLGGGLATWAGIRNGVKATGFNSAGLHVHMRNRLGARLINEAEVDHYNTATDPISQRLESRLLGLTAGSQVGRRHVISGSTGHSLRYAISNLDKP